MRIPTVAMASDTLLSLGRFHLAALDQSESTKKLASEFLPVQQELSAAKSARQLAEETLVGPRVAASFAEHEMERVIRQVSLLAHASDNNTTSGPAFKALFPDGLDPEVRPLGAAQAVAATALRERMNTQPAAAKVKEQAMAGFNTALSALSAALDGRQAAETKLSQARAAEAGARERFVAAYDSDAGAIRQMFPRDKAQQDLHFDEIATSRASSDTKAGVTPPPVTPHTDAPAR